MQFQHSPFKLEYACFDNLLKHLLLNNIFLQYCDKYADCIGFPHLEEWRKELCLSALRNSEIDLETYRDSYGEDEEMLQVAYNSAHFIQHEPGHLTL